MSRTALITGGASGIGLATARLLACQGVAIAILDINEAAATHAVERIQGEGGQARAYAVDVQDLMALRRCAADVEEAFGGIDILINNAGIVSDFCPLEDVTEAMFERSINIHARSALFLTQAIVPGMKRRGSGRIIVVSSINGMVGGAEASTYNAAKGALLALTKGWAKELAPFNIAVNAIAPGPVETPMTMNRPNIPDGYYEARAKQVPLGRWGRPEDIARAIAFLCDPDVTWITGQVISPNGGVTII